MRFNRMLKSAVLFTALVSFSSCGMLGQKDKPKEESKVGATGCLDNSKDLVGRYVKGEMSEAEWKSAFDCINQSLEFFTQYVRGSNEDSYSQGDMYTLISRFLITNRPVHRELMRGAFNLKQALFGGDAGAFTKEQIELLKNALTRLQQITGALIPYLKMRQDPNTTFEELLEMSTAFKDAGDQIADYVSTLPVGDLSDQALTVLIDQLTETLDLPVIDGLDRKVFLAKWMMFNTRRDAIEGQDWPQFFRSAMTVAGIAVAYNASLTIRNPDNKPLMTRLADDYRYREFIWNLFIHLKPTIIESLTKHEGNTPFPLFDHVIDELPRDFLNGMPKDQLKMTVREFVRKFLLSQTQMGVDGNVVDNLYTVLGNLVQDVGSVDRFYEATNLDLYKVKPDLLTQKLSQYEAGLSGAEKARFTGVKNTILAYPPLLQRNDAGDYWIMHDFGNGYSRLQNIYVVAAERFLQHLLRTYGSGDGYFVESDFANIFADKVYGPILFAIKFVDNTVRNFGAKRFRDIDLFTPISDGNQQATIPEIVHYGMEVISAAAMTNKMRVEIVARCGGDSLPKDNLGWEWVPANCFRHEFNERLDYWIPNFPRLQKYWASLQTEDERKQAMRWLEHGSRRDGYSDMEFAKFDFGAMAAILHYTEALFTRFDVNNSEVLSKGEILDAYPVFKTLLAREANMDVSKTYLLKGIFTYIVRYREMPDISGGIKPIAKLGWWLATYALPTTKVQAERSGIFNIVCQLAAPESITNENEKKKKNREICSQ